MPFEGIVETIDDVIAAPYFAKKTDFEQKYIAHDPQSCQLCKYLQAGID